MASQAMALSAVLAIISDPDALAVRGAVGVTVYGQRSCRAGAMMQDNPFEPGRMMETMLYGLSAHVEQLGAELHDPEISSERRAVILQELRAWYVGLQEMRRQAELRASEQPGDDESA